MKEFATSVLYVLSIVVAVAIGMFQVGKEIHGESDKGSRECPYMFAVEYGCNQMGLTPTCRSVYTDVAGNLPYLGKFWRKDEFQCGFYDLEYVPNKPPKLVFKPDPGCFSVIFAPSSEGCSG